MPPNVGDLVNRATRLASLPSVYIRLSEVINDSYSSAEDVAKIISEDVSLTARLLRIVNSAFFSFPVPVDTVGQALQVMGLQQVHDLVLSTSVVDMFKSVPNTLVDMESFWRHSIGCAVCARVIATQRGEANVERLFTSGLLHDIGRLIIYMNEPEAALQVLERNRETGELLHRTEQDILGYDHAEVGSALVDAWNLPSSFQDPIAYHHRPTESLRSRSDAAIVHVADIAAHALRMGSSGESSVPPLDEAAWPSLAPMDSFSNGMFEAIDRQYETAVQTILQSDRSP